MRYAISVDRQTLATIVGTGIGIVLTLAAFMHASHGAIESRMNDRMNRIEAGLNGRLDALNGRLDALNGRLDALDSRLRSVEAQQARMDERMAQVQHALGLRAAPPKAK